MQLSGTLHTSVPVPASLMFGRNVTLSITRSHVRQETTPVLDLLATHRVAPEGVIIQHGAFDDTLELMTTHPRGRNIKTVLTAG